MKTEIADEIIENNRSQTIDYSGGNENIFGFFVGQTMKVSDGKANPKVFNEILKSKLSE